MGLWSGICSVVSSAVGCVSSAMRSIGRGIASFATTLINKVAPYIDGVVKIIH